MGLVTSSGIFRFIPPNPSIAGISSPTGYVNESVQLLGSDLDYIDQVALVDTLCEFNLIDLNTLNVVIPGDAESGLMIATSEEFTVSGQPIKFYPIPNIEFFDPKNSASGELISFNGRAISSATGCYFYAQPLLDDIEYLFTGDNGFFNINNSETNRKNSVLLYVQNINKNNFTGNYKIKNILDYTNTSGRGVQVEIDPIRNRYYEEHIFSFPTISNPDFQTFFNQISTGYRSYQINLPLSFSNTDYSVFYTHPITGSNLYYSYISGKTPNNFYLNFDKILNETGNINFWAISNSGINFDNGVYQSTGISIPTGVSSTGIKLITNKNYPPFLIGGVEYSGAGTAYKINLSDLNKDNFKLNIPENTGNYNLRFNYCTVLNNQIDYDLFRYIGQSGSYKKLYLYSGNAETFLEKIPGLDYQIINKNLSKVKVPYTEFYINGRIGLFGPENINVETNDTFFESPLPTGVFPPFGIRGAKLIISGKSFKKVILNDGTGDYNYISVKFRYADSIYMQNNNNFSTDFLLIDHNTLSGLVPLQNFPSGRYAIQMMAEDGSLFE